uniref:PORF2 n=1 Tax=Oxytricha trifallax TaxID=1172189 RepID=G9HRA2_9SPIT|nr:pORF2 [Oxytricha trifallax]
MLENNENFYGIKILETMKINNITVKIGAESVTLLLGNPIEGVKIIELLVLFKYFFSLSNKIKDIFGLYLSPGMRFIRKKLKREIIEDFSVIELTSFLEGSDPSVYYSKGSNIDIEQVLGIEIRFSEEVYINSDKTIINLIRELGELNKKKYLYDEKK